MCTFHLYMNGEAGFQSDVHNSKIRLENFDIALLWNPSLSVRDSTDSMSCRQKKKISPHLLCVQQLLQRLKFIEKNQKIGAKKS